MPAIFFSCPSLADLLRTPDTDQCEAEPRAEGKMESPSVGAGAVVREGPSKTAEISKCWTDDLHQMKVKKKNIKDFTAVQTFCGDVLTSKKVDLCSNPLHPFLYLLF